MVEALRMEHARLTNRWWPQLLRIKLIQSNMSTLRSPSTLSTARLHHSMPTRLLLTMAWRQLVTGAATIATIRAAIVLTEINVSLQTLRMSRGSISQVLISSYLRIGKFKGMQKKLVSELHFLRQSMPTSMESSLCKLSQPLWDSQHRTHRWLRSWIQPALQTITLPKERLTSIKGIAQTRIQLLALLRHRSLIKEETQIKGLFLT